MLRNKYPLIVLFLVLCLSVADLFRPSQDQVMAKGYLWTVHQYQHYGRSISRKYVRCRYSPTCSEYSIQAVQKYGLPHGLWLTVRRLISCRTSVPFGTYDPVR